MKLIKPILYIYFFNFGFLFSLDSAYSNKDVKKSIGIFQPYTHTTSNNIELSTHPIIFFIKPNLKFKLFHKEKNGVGIATRYSIEYPTYLLKIFQHRGYFALISDDPNIGTIQNLFVFQGELLGTKKFINSNFTGKIGITFCPNCNMDSRHLIDYDLIYPRMALYHYGMSSNAGIDLDYFYSDKTSFKFDIDLLFLPNENTFFEQKTLFNYKLSKKYTISSGYKACYGYYPHTKDKGLWNIFPIIDLKLEWYD